MDNSVDIAWVAGLIEGEGCMGKYTYTRPSGDYTKTILQVEMKDRDILEKLHRITGYGTINYKKARPPSEETWVWSVTRAVHVKEILTAILPHMGERRTKKIQEVLW